MENQKPAHPTPEATEGGVPRSLGGVGSEKFIPVSEVERLSGVSYNTLRYYTKIGLLPYMTRRLPFPGAPSTVGHYPESVLETLKRIKELKKQGLDNRAIARLLATEVASNEKIKPQLQGVQPQALSIIQK